jgi:predicted DNA-binding transcriptional regulator AlpA
MIPTWRTIKMKDLLLLKKEAAERMKISMTGLNVLLKDRKLPKVQLSPRRVAILESDVDAYIAANRG